VGSVGDGFADVIGWTVGEFLVIRRRKKQSLAANEIYRAGLPTRISGSMYGLDTRRSSMWIGGVLEVRHGSVAWHPGYFRAGHGQRITADEFTGVNLRSPTTRESWAVSPECVVLIGQVGRRRVEIGVLQDDMTLVLDALRATRLLD
jgi:hypothetical protein